MQDGAYKKSNYVAKKPNAEGYADYTDEENAIWHELFTRQIKIIEGRACDEYIHGLELLNLTSDKIPQCPDVSAALTKATGWSVAPVAALISFDKFFALLANRQFPAATFIRSREELDYLQEPDIFHEIFGHCPLLTDPVYADFMHQYGKLGLNANNKDRAMLMRLYWFTVEFGLINTPKGIRAYGGGILSSKSETIYSIESDTPQRKTFDALDALRTPYRIDIMQPIYFTLNNFKTLYELANTNLLNLIEKSRELGEYPPTYAIN